MPLDKKDRQLIEALVARFEAHRLPTDRLFTTSESIAILGREANVRRDVQVVVGLDSSRQIRPFFNGDGHIATRDIMTRSFIASTGRSLQEALLGTAASVAPGITGELWTVRRAIYNVAAALGATSMRLASGGAAYGPTVVATAGRSFDLLPQSGQDVVFDGAATFSVTGGDADDTWSIEFVRLTGVGALEPV